MTMNGFRRWRQGVWHWAQQLARKELVFDTLAIRFLLLFLLGTLIPLGTFMLTANQLVTRVVSQAARQQADLMQQALQQWIAQQEAHWIQQANHAVATSGQPDSYCRQASRWCWTETPEGLRTWPGNAVLPHQPWQQSWRHHTHGRLQPFYFAPPSRPLHRAASLRFWVPVPQHQQTVWVSYPVGQPSNALPGGSLLAPHGTVVGLWVGGQWQQFFQLAPHAAAVGQSPNLSALKELLAPLLQQPSPNQAHSILRQGYQLVVHRLDPSPHEASAWVVALPVSPWLSLLRLYFRDLYGVVFVAMGVALGLAYWTTRSLVRPLYQLMQHMQRSETDLQQGQAVPLRVNSVGYEVNQLVRAFNDLAERLAHRNRVQEEFVTTLTHDLKVPLIAEKQTLQYLHQQTYGPLNTEQQDVLQLLQRSNQGVLQLVNSLLNVYRYDNGAVALQRTVMPVVPLLQQVWQELLPWMQDKQQTPVWQPPPKETDLQVFADAGELKRVLLNVLGNAVTYTPRRGTITLQWQCAKALAFPIKRLCPLQHSTLEADQSPPFWLQDGAVVISVVDSGPGFRAEQLKHVFQRFRSSDRRSPLSLGLGLYNAQQVVQAHQGWLWLESTEGVGTAVHVLLPGRPWPPADGVEMQCGLTGGLLPDGC